MFPLLDYVCVILLDITVLLDLRLQRAINACVRYIFGLRRYEHVSLYYNRLQWLSVSSRREYFTGYLMYRAIAGNIPISFMPELHYNVRDDASGPCTRSDTANLICPAVRTSVYEDSFTNRGIRMWNNLPATIRNIRTLASFKTALYDYILRQQTVH